MTTAFKHGDVAVVAPLEYTAMIWATLFGYVFWSEVPGLNTWLGVAIVMASGLFILFREANLQLPRGRAGAADWRSEEQTYELQSLMRTSYEVFCLKKKI